ncbi:hypothetical protein ACU64K_12745 (plasmid) [Enterococcus faecium]
MGKQSHKLGALAFEGTVLDNISIVFEEESFTLECDKLTRYIDPKFYEDKNLAWELAL